MSDPLSDFRHSSRPGEDSQKIPWSIRRAKAGQELKMMVLSTDIFGCYVHYHNKRTVPCRLTGCKAGCPDIFPRWKGYLLARVSQTGEYIIFEFTPPAVHSLDEALKKYGTMRGLLIKATRFRNKENGRVIIEVKGITVPADDEPPPFSPWDFLSGIWGINPSYSAKFRTNREDNGSFDATDE